MKRHGNSSDNTNPHHLYEIIDSVEDDVFKYGISDESIDEDGMSSRMKLQVNFLNLGVNWVRFFSRILVLNISGRRNAKALETKYIEHYKTLKGRKPRGNIY